MSSPTFDREQSIAVDAVRAAAQLCQAVQADIGDGVLKKEDRTPVTVADFGSQAVICRALRTAFPDDPIIAEEDSSALQTADNAEVLDAVVQRVQDLALDADRDAVCQWIDYGNASEYHDRFWTLDPIDGTKGFVRGDQYAIALALVIDGRPHVSALACPNLPDDLDDPNTMGQIFTAVHGAGAHRVPAHGADGQRETIKASPVSDVADGQFCDSFVSAHSSHDMALTVGERLGISKPPIRMDSQAKYALVARGDVEIYFRLPRGGDYTERIWDHAAGMLVVEEAGGRVTDVHGDPLDFSHGHLLSDNYGIVASNGRFHDAVLQALDAVGA
jgi:3'(2'), 5'-bisphosphate nucleotidase